MFVLKKQPSMFDLIQFNSNNKQTKRLQNKVYLVPGYNITYKAIGINNEL